MKEGERRPPHSRQLLRVCGLAAVAALFDRDPRRVERLLFEDRLKGEVGSFCRTLAQARKPYRQVDKAELARIAGTPLHGSVVAIATPQPLADFDRNAARIWARNGKPLLVLDGIGNPHNLGAIARSAAFFGLERMVLADRPDQALPSDASYRVAEGGLEHLNLHRTPLPAALFEMRPAYRVIGTALGHGAVPDRLESVPPVALVFGNEETGLDAATIGACDQIWSIPGSGRVQSLNVAAAAAILLYLLTRP
ncbi:MAG TPA: RNA methyltransferase [Stellaceae bacterium]|jgi:TrmH RNA methyltransferase|nr:RNA methyltransferase [Stellaceae bacterium]